MKLKKKTLKKSKPKTKKYYFGKEAHAAIIAFQNSNCNQEKQEIYNKKIKASFEKLVENLIFIHGFSKDKEHYHIIKSDCISFLYEILEKFDKSKGSKAFSYFNVCAKNFLIIQTKKTNKLKQKHISIFDEKLSNIEKEIIENSQVIPSQEDTIIKLEEKKELLSMLSDIKNKVTNQNEIACINAIITIFKKIEDLEFLNKRAIFVYLREISGLNAKQLSVAMSNLRKHYKFLTKETEKYIFFNI